jgi:membrane-associated protease RseP (regulator of RpoE activity)
LSFRVFTALEQALKRSNLNWNLILLLATIGTTLWAGYQFSLPLVEKGLLTDPWMAAASFSLGLLVILGCHEMGHKLMADRRSIKATFPYFIPVPFFLGTFGAIIKMKSRPYDRNALFDVGAAGPISGFIALIPLTILGIYWSFPLSAENLQEFMVLPSPILFDWLSESIAHIPQGGDLLLHPLALAGWVGMIITTLNLLPVATLDGGHISRALVGSKYHRLVSFIGVVITFLLGYWVFGLLILLFAMRRHPGPTNDLIPLSKGRKFLSLGLLAMLVLCVAPIYQSLI